MAALVIGEFVEKVYFPHLEEEGMKPSTIAGIVVRVRIADGQAGRL